MVWIQRGPLSLSGNGGAQQEANGAAVLRLRVLEPAADAGPPSDACVSMEESGLAGWDWGAGPPFLQMAAGSDCSLRLSRSADVPVGCLLLSAVQALNLHVCGNETYSFRVIEPTAKLAELEVEARLLERDAGEAELDAAELLAALRESCTGSLLAVGEVVVLHIGTIPLRLRVSGAHTLSAAHRQEAVGYHSYRGLLTKDTAVYLLPEAGLILAGNPARPVLAPSAHCVTVYTNDEEYFVVPARVLRPCIALTRAIRAAGPAGGSEVHVDVDCCVFDRALLFLEAQALNATPPSFSLALVDELAEAARVLGLRSLADYCATRQDAFVTRLREYRFEEVVAANAAGACLLIIDGMVLDVLAWLPEHPGGASIMPAQSLNIDAARHFELYHHSRESFLYLRHFYVGEIAAEDRGLVPSPSPGPSDDFLAQLADLSAPFRLARAEPRHF